MPLLQDRFYFRFMQKNLQNKIPTGTVFKRFKQIPLNSHRDFYTFYKAYTPEICLLDFEEYVEIKFNFILALFHLDKYAEFYFCADDMMSELLNSPSFDIRSRVVYEQILWYKAEAFRNQRKTKNAQYLYCELLKMNPVNKKYKYILRNLHAVKCMTKNQMCPPNNYVVCGKE